MTGADREVLREAAIHAGLPPSEADRFCEAVEARLAVGAREYGDDNYLGKTFVDCEAEAIEEQHDAGGWSTLALRLLERDIGWGFPDDVAGLVRLHVLQGVAQAQGSERSFRQAIALYEQEAHNVDPPAELHPAPISCGDDL